MEREFSMENLIEHYNRRVDYYREKSLEGWHLRKEVSEISKILDSILRRRACNKALDIACHDGRYTFLLREKGLEAVGIDTSEKSLAYAESVRKSKDIGKVRFLRMDATEMTFQERFDIIILMELLHHLPDSLATKVLGKALDLLESGGYLILDLKNRYNPVINRVYKWKSSKSLLLITRTMKFYERTVNESGARIVLKQGLVTPFWQIEPFVIVLVRKN